VTEGKMNMKKTQSQLFYDAQRKTADLDHAFLEMAHDGMTADELKRLIKKRPETYSRFAHWVKKLP